MFYYPQAGPGLQEELAEQEMAQVVCREAELVAIGRVARPLSCEEPWEEDAGLVRVGEVHGRIAHQRIQRPAQSVECIHKVANTAVGGQVAVENLVGVFEHTCFLRRLLCLLEIPAGHNDIPVSRCRQLFCCSQAQTRRGPGDDDCLLVGRCHEGHLRHLDGEPASRQLGFSCVALLGEAGNPGDPSDSGQGSLGCSQLHAAMRRLLCGFHQALCWQAGDRSRGRCDECWREHCDQTSGSVQDGSQLCSELLTPDGCNTARSLQLIALATSAAVQQASAARSS